MGPFSVGFSHMLQLQHYFTPSDIRVKFLGNNMPIIVGPNRVPLYRLGLYLL